MYNDMDIIKLILDPVVGDTTLKAPQPYVFTKAIFRDYVEWMNVLSTCGDFVTSPPELYHNMIYPRIAGYIVRLKDKIVGCAALSMYNGFPTIMYLWVDPEHRRKRIGWFLVNMCILRAKANSYYNVRAIVARDNLPTLELFKKIGFVEKDRSLGG